MICGLVLAGGRSSRFGSEKAVAEVGGVPLIERVVAVLARGCEQVAVSAGVGSAAAGFAAARGLILLQDAAEDAPGPLAGVRAGLAWARDVGAEALLTAPCDTPFLPQDLAARLVLELRGDCGAVVARTEAGLQPLCALWRVEQLDAVAAALVHGRHPPVHALLTQLGAIQVSFEDDAFLNINTRGDQVRAAART